VDVGFLAVEAVRRGLQGELHVVWCRTPNFAVASASNAFGAKYLLVDCTISVLQVAVGIVSVVLSISFSIFS
jgi:hypothetical protein